MATPWPTTLPQCPVLNGFSEQKQPNVASFLPDVGPPKLRRRSTAAGWATDVAFRMTNAQVLTFNTFYETTLFDGTLPFDWAHPITKVNYSWMFQPNDVPKRERMTPNTSRISFSLIRLP